MDYWFFYFIKKSQSICRWSFKYRITNIFFITKMSYIYFIEFELYLSNNFNTRYVRTREIHISVKIEYYYVLL